MAKHHTQAVPRRVGEAIDLVSREMLRILANAGINISAKDSKENRAKFLEVLKAEGIEIQKVLHPDRRAMSGVTILKNGVQIGFIPVLGVTAEDGKKVFV